MLRKIVSLLSVLAIFTGILCSCSNTRQENISLNGKEYSADEVVLEIGEHKVSLDFFRYSFLTVKATLEENGTTDFTKKENAELLKKETLEQTKYMFAVLDLAKKYGYSLSKENLDEIDSTMKNTFDSAGSASDYLALLEQNNLTNEVYKEVLEINNLGTLMSAALFGTDKKESKIVFTEKEAIDDYSKNNYRLMNIYFAVDSIDEDGVPLSDSEIEKNKSAAEKKANTAIKEIKNGASFEDTMKKYMGNDAYESDLQSYYDPKAISEPLGYDVSKLKVGETSELIFAQNCYYIIHRLECDEEYLSENSSSLVSVYSQKLYEEEVNKISDSLKITETKLYNQIAFDSFSK